MRGLAALEGCVRQAAATWLGHVALQQGCLMIGHIQKDLEECCESERVVAHFPQVFRFRFFFFFKGGDGKNNPWP